MRRSRLIVGLTLLAIALGVSDRMGAGRSLWYPTLLAMTGSRTHEQVIRNLTRTRRAGLRQGLPTTYPPTNLTLIGLKEERRLEVWTETPTGWARLRDYPVLGASGGPGPKLREGDLQVPEGLYRLTSFNPNSSYHLSLRVDYPSREDIEAAHQDGRSQLGGDIFIHGKAVSVGCLAIGDEAIEELYLLVADVGLTRTRALLAPSARPQTPPGAPAWLAKRYDLLQRELRRVRGD